MDRDYIESQQIVARYLSGDLTVREARQFEKFCLENSDWLKSQPIPVRLKAKMTRKPGEELDADDLAAMPSNTAIEAAHIDDDDDDDRHEPGKFGTLQPTARRWIKALSLMLVLAVGGVAGAMMYANSISKQLTAMQKDTKEYRMRAPGSKREFHVKMSNAKPTSPTVDVGWPNSPVLIELIVDMSEERYNMFRVTVANVSEGHVAEIQRVAKNSNRELRFNLNSSAFGPGEYDVKFDGYTWRGDTVGVGWIRLGMK